MTLTSSITAFFAELGTITSAPDIEFTRESPLVMEPSRTFVARRSSSQNDDEAHPTVTAWIYRRFNGTKVLRIDIETRRYEALDIMDLSRWVVRNSGRMPFATIRLRETHHRNASLIVTHSMVAEDVTDDGLCEVISGMVYVWGQCVTQLNDMDPLVEECYEGPESLDRIDAEDSDECDAEPEIDTGEDSSESNRIDSPTEKLTDRDIFGARGNPGLLKADGDASSIIDELEALIGLNPVKAMVYQLAAQQKIAGLREDLGLRAVVPSPHLCFMGNPGTGKTTVARLIGKLYKALGLLSSGHVVEAERTSLVSGYLGQTALKTREICERALNGVLFIDEAYSLAVEGRDYGQEVIETLLTFMETHRNEFVLVVAGYPAKMLEFLNSNPGLRSRFDVFLNFPDYDMDELMSMFTALVQENQYTLTPEASAAVMFHIDSWPRHEGFGNGRDVRRLFNMVIGNQAAVLALEEAPSFASLQLITAESIPEPLPIQVDPEPDTSL